MKLKTIAINLAAKLILDKQLWSDVKTFVMEVDDSNLSNAKKHDKVLKNIKTVFGNDLANHIINLAITLAVAWARTVKVEV